MSRGLTALVGVLVASSALFFAVVPTPRGLPATTPVAHVAAVTPAATPPFSIGMDATLVIGRTTVSTATQSGVTATNISHRNAVESDRRGDMWVLDTGANRALE